MKHLLAFSLMCIILAFTACDKDKEEGTQTESFNLGTCKTKSVGGDNVSICYDKLINESRCPANATCVWQGIAVAQFSFTVNNDKHTLTLATWKWKPPYDTDTTIGRYKIHLQELGPYPEYGREPATPWATVSITRQ